MSDSPILSKDIYKQIYDASNDAIILLDKDKFLDCNQATLDIFGYKAKAEFINKHPSEHSPARQADGSDSGPASAEHIKKAYQDGRDFFEWIHRRGDKTNFYADVLIARVTVDKKDFLQATVRDVSDRKEKERASEKINEVMVGRELKMIELKKKIKELEKQLKK
jgi:PAS domain S-box-containing protein